MKKYCFILLFIFSISVFSKQYIIVFDKYVEDVKGIDIIKRIDTYNMIVVDENIDKLKELFPDAIGIYEDKRVYAVYIPNDEYFPYQWNLRQEHYNISNLLDNGILGSKAIIIGILDTGIAFEDYLIPSYEESKVYSSDGYYHKYIDFNAINFIQGYDFVNNDEHPNDMNGHGTSCASIIASTINNFTHMSGIIYNASIMPLRVLDENGEGNMSDIVDAIDYAVNNGCNVLNLSLAGSPGDSTGWTPLHLAIIDARQKGVSVVCATGNEGVNQLSYPAGFEEAISVGAVDYYKDRTPYSQYGENLDFVAPGGYVYQDIDNDGYYDGGILIPTFDVNGSLKDVSSINIYYGEGTSFAAPHISALIGLLYSLGYDNVDEIESMLIESSIDLGVNGYDEEYGWGYPLPDSLFNIPLIVKTVDFDIIKNGLDIAIIKLIDTLKIDSMIFKGKFFYKKIDINFNNSIEIFTINELNTGYYNFIVYYEYEGEKKKLSKKIIVKSPLDNTGIVYDGNTSYVFSSNGVIIKDNEKLSVFGDNIDVNVKHYINDNPSKYRVVHNGKSIDIKRYSKYIEFNINNSGFYKIEYFNNNVFVSKQTQLYKTIVLNNDIMILDEEFEIFNITGRRVLRSKGFKANIKQLNKGIYFIKKGSEIWKAIKVY